MNPRPATFSLKLWRGFGWTFGRVLAPILLRRRRARGKEDPLRFREKMARGMRARPKGPLIWVHAASVGESKSVLPLIEATLARRPDAHLLITTGTLTSARMLEKDLPPRAIHQFAPLDVPPYVHRFLKHWKPDLVLWVESEFWPTALSAIAARRIPAILINARLSDRSFRRLRRLRSLSHEMMRSFVLGLAPTKEMAERLQAIGLNRVKIVGNLKGAADALAHDEGALQQLRDAIGTRPVFVAASTHEGEDAILADAVTAMVERHKDVLAIIVPRHPERGAKLRGLYGASGVGVALRSAGDAIDADTRFYIADTMGELGLFYRLAGAVFMGGSLIAHGGQNPLEPARLGLGVAHGPHVFNFREAYGALSAVGAATLTQDTASLAAYASARFDDPEAARLSGEAAREAASADREALNRTLAFLAAFLRQLGHHAPT